MNPQHPTSNEPAALDPRLVQRLNRPRLQGGVLDRRWGAHLLDRTRFAAERLPLSRNSARRPGPAGAVATTPPPIVFARPHAPALGETTSPVAAASDSPPGKTTVVQRAALPGHGGADPASMAHPSPSSRTVVVRDRSPRATPAAPAHDPVKPALGSAAPIAAGSAAPAVKPSATAPVATDPTPPVTSSLRSGSSAWPVARAKSAPARRLPRAPDSVRPLRETSATSRDSATPQAPAVVPAPTGAPVRPTAFAARSEPPAAPVGRTGTSGPIIQRAVRRPRVIETRMPPAATSAPASLPWSAMARPSVATATVGGSAPSGAAIQRAGEPTVGVRAAPSPQPSLPAMTATPPNPTVDVAGLADQVYRRLLQQLTRERERRGY